MSKVATIAMTRTQDAYSSALTELGFKGGVKKESLSMSIEMASAKVSVKITADSSIKIITTEYAVDGKTKETTQTFFPPASDFSAGIVMEHVKQVLSA